MKGVITISFICCFGMAMAQQKTEDAQITKEPTAEKLYNDAQNHLKGENGASIDTLKAMNLFVQSANMGYAPAQYEACLSFFNTGYPSLGLEWLLKSAEQDYCPAILYLWGYRMNEGNLDDANRWLRKGAELGDSKCQWFLGYNYHFGDDGFPVNSTQAVFWLEKAAMQNQPEAANELGEMYLFADIVKRDIHKAVFWLKKAAELGDSSAQYNLSLMYQHGEGVDIDKEMAFKLMKESASIGYAKAQNNLGLMFLDGIGCQKDIESARFWLESAIKNKDADDETRKMAKDNLEIINR